MKQPKMIEFYENGLPLSRSLRILIGDFVDCEALAQFPCDYGFLPINAMRFSFQDSETPIEPLIEHLRKNGIAIMYIKETKLEKYPLYEFQRWFDIGFFAFTTEN